MFSIVAATFIFPSEGSSFSLFSSTLVVVLFDCDHSSRCEVMSHCGFVLYFLMTNNGDHL